MNLVLLQLAAIIYAHLTFYPRMLNKKHYGSHYTFTPKEINPIGGFGSLCSREAEPVMSIQLKTGLGFLATNGFH